jgi:signal transduction histidine kinase
MNLMKTKSGATLPVERDGALLIIILVAAAYTSAFINAPSLYPPITTALLLAMGMAYVVIGIYGSALCEQRGDVRSYVVYFAVQIPLLALIASTIKIGSAWLLPLPLVEQAVEYLPRRWFIVVAAIVAAAVGPTFLYAAHLIEYYRLALQDLTSGGYRLLLAQSSFQYIVAVAFVVVFTRLAMRERKTRTEVERLAGELGEANRRLREYAAQAEDMATIKERNRLARDIHDSLGHYLTVINVQIGAARTVMEKDPARAIDALGKAQTLTQEGLTEVRRSVSALRSAVESGPLSKTVEALLDEYRAGGIAATLVVNGTPRSLAPQAELTLYRAAQEGLTNARKHARATHLQVTLDYGNADKVRLAVEDDGLGSEDSSGGFGLLGVRERVQLLGGAMRVRTTPGQGFSLEVEVPG